MAPLCGTLGLTLTYGYPGVPTSPLCLLHWVYCWKSSRQWSACPAWPPGLSPPISGGGAHKAGSVTDASAHARRKALLRAYASVYTSVCAPPTRHALSAFSWPPLAGGGLGARVTVVSAINTTHALVIASWGSVGEVGHSGAAGDVERALPSEKVIPLMEKLAKALKLQNDRLFLVSGPPSF